MIKSLTHEEKEKLFEECFDNEEEMGDDDYILYHSLEVYMGPCCCYDYEIYNHSSDLEKLKSLYQNYIFWEFVNSLCYNEDYDNDNYNLIELMNAKEKDFDFNVKNQETFNKLKEELAKEPKTFKELRDYIKLTSKMLFDLGVYCQAKLYLDFSDAVDEMTDMNRQEVPVFDRKVDYLHYYSHQG